MLAAVLTSLAGRGGALPRWVLPLVFGFALALRLAVSTHPHSGEGVPPMFGDYEAQRHWMEITIHTPLREWYVDTKANDLQYWGLDYPPLTAYQSWLYGKVVAAFEPDAVRLTASRGYETDSSKRLMRYSVIVSDAVFLLPAAYAVARAWHASERVRSRTRTPRAAPRAATRPLAWGVGRRTPPLILVDHGHFQYNGISLGLTMYAVAAVLVTETSSVRSCSRALNHKQMSAYFAPAFFAHLLGKCLSRARNPSARARAAAVARLGAAVVGTFVIVWAPFFLAVDPKTHTKDGWEGVLRVLARLAPLERGLYEDYVANFWCATNPLFRWRRMATRAAAQAALAATVAAIAPSMAHQIAHPTNEGFLWCLFNCASGFLFSFQASRSRRCSRFSRRPRLAPTTRTSPRVPDRGVALDVAAAPEGQAARRVRRDGARVRRARGRGAPGAEASEGTKELRSLSSVEAERSDEYTRSLELFAARALATRARRDVRRSGGAALA